MASTLDGKMEQYPNSSVLSLITSEVFRDFHSHMTPLYDGGRLSHTGVGFNFLNGKILSTKFYYVFRDAEFVRDHVAFPLLRERLADAVERRSMKHFGEKISPGSWLVLTVKFDEFLTPSQGFFLRVNTDNAKLVENVIAQYPDFDLQPSDFEPGYAQYVMETSQGIRTSEYLYLIRPSCLAKLGEQHDISFDKVDCVEITSAADDISRQKFIAVKMENVAGPTFMRAIPDIIHEMLKGVPSHLCCPTVQPATGQYSIYAVSPWKNGSFTDSLLDRLVENAGAAVVCKP